MRVLVTGGAGYIGSVCAELLLKRGAKVTVLDDMSQGHRGAVVEEANLIVGDIGDRETVKEALRLQKIDSVMHFAASSIVGESMAHPHEYYDNNVWKTLVLLSSMAEAGVKRFVFSSSAAVYGEPKIIPIAEDARTEPTNVYGETKLALERALPWYKNAYGIDYVSLRYFNAAGATETLGEDHEPETHLIPLALETVMGNREVLEIYGDDYPTKDGSCVRDYIHISDLSEAHILAVEKMGRLKTRVFNLGNGQGYSVFEVVEAVNEVTGTALKTRVSKRRSGDPAVLVAGSELAEKELGWSPKHPELQDIVESAWKWKRKHKDGYGKP
jgi:UDP-glucose 4-epimerase